jgi:hypothetical protein
MDAIEKAAMTHAYRMIILAFDIAPLVFAVHIRSPVTTRARFDDPNRSPRGDYQSSNMRADCREDW